MAGGQDNERSKDLAKGTKSRIIQLQIVPILVEPSLFATRIIDNTLRNIGLVMFSLFIMPSFNYVSLHLQTNQNTEFQYNI